MKKIIAENIAVIVFIFIVFALGFSFGFMLRTPKVIKDTRIVEAKTTITNFIERVEKEHSFIETTEGLSLDTVAEKYNSLLLESRKVSESMNIILTENERLHKAVERKLFFLAGGHLFYSYDNRIIDAGVNLGIEYKKVSVLVGYSFIQRGISLQGLYRF